MNLSHKITRTAVKPLLRVFIHLEIKGAEHIPMNSPLIMVANHVHLLDPVLLLLVSPRWINFMAKEELFHLWPMNSIMRWAQAFPVSRRRTVGGGKQALQQARGILEKGSALGMFPEGKRSQEARLLPGHAGPVLLALKTRAPLVPIGICGTEKLEGLGWLQHPKVTINIGQPFTLTSTNDKMTKAQLKPLVDHMMGQIASLLSTEHQEAHTGSAEPGLEFDFHGKVRY